MQKPSYSDGFARNYSYFPYPNIHFSEYCRLMVYVLSQKTAPYPLDGKDYTRLNPDLFKIVNYQYFTSKKQLYPDCVKILLFNCLNKNYCFFMEYGIPVHLNNK